MGRKAVTGRPSVEKIENLSFDSPAIHVGSVTLRPRIASGLPLSREDLFAGNSSTTYKPIKLVAILSSLRVIVAALSGITKYVFGIMHKQTLINVLFLCYSGGFRLTI